MVLIQTYDKLPSCDIKIILVLDSALAGEVPTDFDGEASLSVLRWMTCEFASDFKFCANTFSQRK